MIILGVLDLWDMTVESPETVAARIRRALPHVDAAKVILAPDCGLKYLPRDVTYGKMRAMVLGADIVHAEPISRVTARIALGRLERSAWPSNPALPA